MSSGVKVDDVCKTVFEDLKIRKKYQYIIYRLSDDLKCIQVDCCGEPGETYDDFKAKLKAAEAAGQGRYAVYDCAFDKDDAKKTKIVFMMWIPEGIPIRQKMLYTSSKKALMPKLQGLAKEMQCNDDDDTAWGSVVEKCQSKYD